MSRVLQLFVASETKIPSSFEDLTAVPQVSEVLSIYMCNIVKSLVNNSKSSRTYTQEARETPVLNLITL